MLLFHDGTWVVHNDLHPVHNGPMLAEDFLFRPNELTAECADMFL